MAKNGKIKLAQIWIETVIYTLIGLSLIGITLAFVTPKVTDARDRAVVEQTIEAMNSFDSKISEVLRSPGTTRVFDFTLKRGNLIINSSTDEIIFLISDLRKPYSQPGVEIGIGRVKIKSEEGQKNSKVAITLEYKKSQGESYADIRFSENNLDKLFTPANIPYRFQIINRGINSGSSNGAFIIEIKEIRIG